MAKMVVEKGKFALRVAINIVIAGIIYALISSLMASLGTVGGVIGTAIVSLIVLLFVVPYILERHPGEETLMSLILALPVGFALISALEVIFNVTMPVLPLSSLAIGSISMVLAITSYMIADLISSAVIK